MNTAEKLRFLTEKAETGEEFLCMIKDGDVFKQKFIDGNLHYWSEIKERWEITYIRLDGEDYKELPWVPKDGGDYYYWNGKSEMVCYSRFCKEDIFDLSLLSHDAIYRTKEEAEQKGPVRYEELLKEYEERVKK